MAGLRLDQRLDGRALGIDLGIVHQVKNDAGATLRRRPGRKRRHRIFALAVGAPLPGLIAPGAVRQHIHPFGDHEGRIEADAEAADQRVVFSVAVVRGEAIEERLGARARDGAERFDHFIARHADAIVLDRKRALVGIDGKRDARLRVIAEQAGFGDRLIA